jgi:hypothetical protein
METPPKAPEKPLTQAEALKKLRFYYDTALPFLNTSHHTKQGEYVKDVFVENCVAQREFHEAFKVFMDATKADAGGILVPVAEINALSEKLFELRFLVKMIHAVGLGSYEKEILAYEIQRKWAMRLPVLPPIAPEKPAPTSRGKRNG